MKSKTMAIGTSVAVLYVIVIILASGLAYEYATSTNQISRLNSQVSALSIQVTSLNQSGIAFCLKYQLLSSDLGSFGIFLSNHTATLQNQVQNDESLIATLNSIRPSGYANMIATLQRQISDDQYAILQIQAYWMKPGISAYVGLNCTASSRP